MIIRSSTTARIAMVIDEALGEEAPPGNSVRFDACTDERPEVRGLTKLMTTVGTHFLSSKVDLSD